MATAPEGTIMSFSNTALAATMAPLCTITLCNTIAPTPMSTLLSMVHPSRCTRWPMTQSSPTVVPISAVVCTTQPSCTEVRSPIEIVIPSPRSTAHGHTELCAPMVTLPIMTASGWMNAVASMVGSNSLRA